MRTSFTFAIFLSLLSATSILALSNGNAVTYALCSEITDPNVSCDEQYNSRSNVETTTSTTTTEEEEEENFLFCSDLKCNLGEEYVLDPDTSIEDTPLDLLDY
ncbi:MAG: hypothetical protein M3Y25_06880 [Thermoproteota archaeon]|nr:hypothetical protein [Thermoproteota archaeon]